MSTTTDLLSKLFNDPKTGFVGAEKLLRRAKQYNTKITLAQVKEFLKDNSIHQVFQKPAKVNTAPRIHIKLGIIKRILLFLLVIKPRIQIIIFC